MKVTLKGDIEIQKGNFIFLKFKNKRKSANFQYDITRACSSPNYDNQFDCESNNFIWSISDTYGEIIDSSLYNWNGSKVYEELSFSFEMIQINENMMSEENFLLNSFNVYLSTNDNDVLEIPRQYFLKQNYPNLL